MTDGQTDIVFCSGPPAGLEKLIRAGHLMANSYLHFSKYYEIAKKLKKHHNFCSFALVDFLPRGDGYAYEIVAFSAIFRTAHL